MSGDERFAGGTLARYLLLGSSVFLSLVGVVMVFSASSVSDMVKEGTSTYHLVRQLAYIAVGLPAAYVLARFDYRRLKGQWMLVWLGSMGLLLLTFLLGVVRGGARRWIPLGIFTLQPSEIAKVAAVIVAAALVVEWHRGKMSDWDFIKRVTLFSGVPAAVVMAQPDLGTAMALLIAVAIVLFVGGIPYRWIAAVGAFGVSAGIIGILSEPFRMKRVIAFLDPFADPLGKGYQTVQALIAFGTGGVGGLGLGMSRQKFFYLPEAHTDFIFAIIGEEAGLIGALAVVAAFGVFLYAGVRVALGSRDNFGRLVAGGLTGMLAVQAVMNMMAVTSLMPVTGKPLPFVSSGGSSMIVTLASVGLILSVSRYGGRAPRAVKPSRPERKPTGEDLHERRRDRRPRVPSAVRSGGARRRA